MMPAGLGHPWTVVARASAVAVVLAMAPWLGAHDPWDPAVADLLDALRPPAWLPGGDTRFLFGTDALGRDLLALIARGLLVSGAVGLGATILAVVVGTTAGLVAAAAGRRADAVLMGLADVHLTFPPLVTALVVEAVVVSSHAGGEGLWPAIVGVTLAIGWSQWAPVVRVVRAAALTDVGRDHVVAARACGASTLRIVRRHLWPGVVPLIWALASTQVGTAILAEATLSFIGLGIPSDTPSLGTLVRQGADHLVAGRWWLAVLPGLTLTLVVLALGGVAPDVTAARRAQAAARTPRSASA